MGSVALAGSHASVTLIDQKAQTLSVTTVIVPTGSSGWDQRLTQVCHHAAIDGGCSHWAQPYQRDSASPVEWLIFTLFGRTSHYLRTFGTREAAEMWVLHHEH